MRGGGGPGSGVYAFASFRLDPRRRVLTHDGVEVPLRPTVFALLLHLVENPERIVGKEEFFEAVWRRRAVEEANLTQTVSALRAALRGVGGEDAEALVATIRGQGYRFRGDVRWEPAADAAASNDRPDGPPGRPPEDPPSSRGRRVPSWLLAGAGVLVLAGLGAAALLARPDHPQSAGNTVVLSEFDNRTRDPVFDRTLASVLRIDLGQSPFVTVQPEKATRDALALMTRPKDARVTTDLAQEVCVRTNADSVLSGAVDAVGAQYLLTLVATDCSGRHVLAQEKAVVVRREAVVPALDRLIDRVRRKLGEPIASVDRFDVPLAPARTASLEALRAYSEGLWLNDHGRQAEAIPALRQAVALDPTFAAAWAALGVAAAGVNADAVADDATARAYALRGELNAREGLRVEMLYHLVSRRDPIAAIGVLQRWTTVYPNDAKAWTNLANAEVVIGRYAQARQDADRSLALHSTGEAAYVVAARADLGDGRPDLAQAVGAAAARQGLADDSVHRELMEAAFMRHDLAALAKEMAWARAHPGLHGLLTQAQMAYAEGHVRQGDQLFDQLAALSRKQGLPSFAQPYQARLLADFGWTDRARRLLASATDPSDRDLIFTLAEVGDPARAERLIRDSIAQHPTGVLAAFVSAPEARAALALRRHDPSAAVLAIAPALPYQAANFDISYVLGNACLAAKDGPGARHAFETILDHQGWSAASPLYPLAQLGLARALAAEHDLGGARAAYARFLAGWKDADPDVPILAAARREAAALG
jgi:DNA-binding winged helix-turn-helix (wHTH) protein/tetratricopeptide (TPR) repeat protein